ncbi:MAG: mechanosensitive ion channel family protein [Thiothrix sp.]|nr:MAG: mechanosensitive ion channel family protein [Thiothrix sp.]
MSDDLSLAYQRAEKMLQQLIAGIPNLLVALLVFAFFWLLAALIKSGVRRFVERTGQPSSVAIILSRVASWVMYGFGIMVAMTVLFPTLDAASFFSALGVSSIAIGFAFKDVFQNLLAGLLILITRPFRIGDQIVSGSHEGTIEEIMVRATRMRTYDNREVIIPNSELFTTRVVVNTAKNIRRTSVVVGIGYGDNIQKAKEAILEGLRQSPDILQEPPPQILARELGDFSINLEVRVWSDPGRQREILEAQDKVIEIIHRVLPAAGIDMPFPTRQILFHDQTESTDGNRAQQREGWPARTENPLSRQELQCQAQQATDSPTKNSVA